MKTNYSLKPSLLRRGMRTRWQVNQYFWSSVKIALLWVGILLGSLLLWNTSVLSETIYEEYKQRNKVEEVIMSCLEHGAAYFGGELHLCRPVNTWFKKETKWLK